MNHLQEVFQAHDISLSEDEVSREVERAIEVSGGLPEYIRTLADGGWSDGAEVRFTAAPVQDRVGEIVAETLGRAKRAGLESDSGQQLTSAQINLFRRGFGAAPIDPRAKAVLELAAMHATALTFEQAARVFGASVEDVQGLIAERRLYGIEAGGEHRIPIFQLDEQGHPLPHIGEVLPHLSQSIHPVGVLHWFTDPNPDLASEETHYASLSPRTWLLSELPAEPVCELAKYVA